MNTHIDLTAQDTTKPIIELTAAHVGKQLRITDQHLSIEGTLSSVRFWCEREEVMRFLNAEPLTRMSGLFVEVEVFGIDGTTQLTTKAEFQVIE